MKKILVVDDQPDNVFILQDRLEREGFEIITAYDGTSGIQKAEDEDPDIILLDVMMPGLSGFEVCKRLVNSDKTKDIPIILVTALTDATDLQKGLNAGAFDYVKKPFNRIELVARINSALRLKEANNLVVEAEKLKTYAATVLTANHEIKQPLTLINLSTAAVRREVNKEEITKDSIIKRIEFIETAANKISEVLDKLTTLKKPVFKDYLNEQKMIDIDRGKSSD